MQESSQNHAISDPNTDQHAYVSFILRCWVGKGGNIHARLIETNTGASHLITDLDMLAKLVRQLITKAIPPELKP